MMTIKTQSEQMGEAFAHQFLSEHFGAEAFVGSGVEIKLQELAHIIYQDVPEPSYFGATICFSSGNKYVALNTHQSLRVRYFTAAHELWHVLGYKEMMSEQLDHERAADRFAAALMLPGTLIRLLWPKLKKKMEQEKAIILIADMASAPYEATARRVNELSLPISSELFKYTDNEWIETRKKYLLPDSPLDQSFSLEAFNKYEKVVAKAVQSNMLEPLEAASQLAQVAPAEAKKYQQEALSKLASVDAEEENET